MNSGGQTNTQFQLHTHINRVRFDSKLVFSKENKYGAKLYHDFSNNCAVNM